MADGIAEAHRALDRLGVPRAEGEEDDVDRVFTLTERIEGFWPYPLVRLACGHEAQGDPSKPVRCLICEASATEQPAPYEKRCLECEHVWQELTRTCPKCYSMDFEIRKRR